MNWHRLAADVVLIVHALFIAFVLLGLLITWVGYFRSWEWTRRWGFRLAHLAAIGLVVVQSYLGVNCPLTDFENSLRISAGQNPYGDSGYIAYWLHRVIFFSAPPWVFTICYTAFALLVIGTFIVAPPRRRVREQPLATATS
jgi:hypothetical protein